MAWRMAYHGAKSASAMAALMAVSAIERRNGVAAAHR